MPKLKSIVTAYKAQPNPQVPGVVDILGAFDRLNSTNVSISNGKSFNSIYFFRIRKTNNV